MAFDLRAWGAGLDGGCDDKMSEGVELCPFLRNMGVTTSLALNKLKFPVAAPSTRAGRGPIFEDGPGLESSFRLYHGKDGVVPLKRGSEETSCGTTPNLSFNPLSASAAATISLSSFGAAGPFGFDGFMENFMAKGKASKKKAKKQEPEGEREHRSHAESHMHEAMGSDWLATGQCPIAKSFRAASGVLPLVSKMLSLPKGMKYRCPPAIVAARAALAKTSAVRALRPQALPTKVLAIGMLGMALNVPLGVWREHTKKFSPQWFLAVHATIPFIAMLRKAVVMPKYAIAFTIGSAVLGQAVGARAERLRLAKLRWATTEQSQVSSAVGSGGSGVGSSGGPVQTEQPRPRAGGSASAWAWASASAGSSEPMEQAARKWSEVHSDASPGVCEMGVEDARGESVATEVVGGSSGCQLQEAVASAVWGRGGSGSSDRQSGPERTAFVEAGDPRVEGVVPERLAGVAKPGQCGSEVAVGDRGMSSGSRAVLVS